MLLRIRRPFVLLATLLLVFSLGVASARADHGPSTPAQKAIQLTSPAVVLIQLRQGARVILNDGRTGVQGDRNFPAIPAGSGSGFAVTPDGAIVTASHVVEPDRASLNVYFANSLLLPRYDLGNLDPTQRWDQAFAEDGRPELAGLFRRCYRGGGGTCTFRYGGRATYRVWTGSAVANHDRLDFRRAQLLRSTGFANTDVAILKVVDQNVPTVQLAPRGSRPNAGEQMEAIGFPETALNFRSDGATRPTSRGGEAVSTSVGGTSEQLQIDIDVEKGMSGGPAINEAGEVVGLTSFAWRQSSGEPGAVFFRTTDSILAALEQAGISPARGQIDTRFQQGMERFWNHEYTDAIPPLDSVTRLRDGHIAATEASAEAEEFAGGPTDTSPSVQEDDGFPWWAFLLIALAALALIAAVVYYLLRRSGKAGAKPEPARPAPVDGQPVPAHGRTVMSTRPSGPVTEPTLVIQEGSGAGQRYPVTQDTMLGREDSDVIIEDEEVSRRHALVRPVDGKLEISDLRSSNGTRVNGSAVNGVYDLSDGDVIEIGKTRIGVELPAGGGTATSHEQRR